MSPKRVHFSYKINLLLEDRDLNGLVDILRDPAQPDSRAQAALALGELGDVDATESLVRSTLEDPNTEVQAAARQALEQLLGNQVEVVINSYRGGPPEIEPWLTQPAAEGPVYSRKILHMLDASDMEGLVAALRNPTDFDLRAQAAMALGELGDVDATESLVRSFLEDPEGSVQAAAQQALELLHGNRAQLVISGNRGTTPPSEPWLVEAEEDEGEEDEDEDEDEEIDEDEEPALNDDLDLDGLMRIASHESNTRLRLKAIHMLALSSDMRATDILAYLALRDEKKIIRAAAQEALEVRHGDQAAAILKNYQESLSPAGDEGDEFENEAEDEDDFEDEDEDDDSEEDLNEDLAETDLEEDEDLEDDEEREDQARKNGRTRIQQSPSDFPRVSAQPFRGGVVEEAGFPWRTVLLIGLVIVIIVIVMQLLNIGI